MIDTFLTNVYFTWTNFKVFIKNVFVKTRLIKWN